MQKKPWEEDWSQPQGPVTVGTPSPDYQYKAPKAAADVANTQATTAATAAKLPYVARQSAADVRKTQLEAEKLQQLLNKGPEIDKVKADALSGYNSAVQLDAIIKDLEQKYKAGPGSTKGIWGVEDYLPTPSNSDFNNTGNAARGIVGQALGFTGGQLNTATEANMSVGPYLPQASDYDNVIEGKIKRLKELRDAARSRAISQLGGVPDANGNIVPANAANARKDELPPVMPGIGSSGPGAGGPTGGMPGIGGPSGGNPTGPQSNPYNYVQDQYGDSTTDAVAGATKSIPNQLGIKFMDGLNSLFHAGAPDERIREYASQFGVDVGPQLDARKKVPGFRGSVPVTPGGLSIQVPVTDTMSKIANAMAGSPTGTFVGEAGNAAGAGLPQWTAAKLSGNPDLARARLAVARATNPKSAIAGQLVGSAAGNIGGEALAAKGLTAAPMLFRGLQGAERAKAIAPWAARLGDAGFGATSGFTNAPEGQGAAGAALGGILGLGGGILGRRVAKGIGSAMRGVSDPSVGYLAKEGVPLTLGQTVGNSGFAGRAVKGIEDRLSGFPVIGDQISQRVKESMGGFNKAAFKQFDDVASPLSGQTVSDIGPLGVEAANRSIGGAYGNVLNDVRLSADDPFKADMGAAVQAGNALPEPMRARMQYTLPTRVGNSIAPDGSLTGNDLQQALRGLRGDASAVRSEPYGADFGNVANQAQDALTGMVERQSPATMPGLNQANEAYRLKSVLQDAVNRARNGSRSKTIDEFTPSQLSDAAAANAKRFGGTQGTTNQPFFDLTRAGQDVLPNTVPDSGTAGRLSIPLALGSSTAGGAAVGQPIAGLAAGLFGTALYSKAGQDLARAAFLKRPEILRLFGKRVQDAAPYSGLLGATSLLQLQQQ